MANWGLYAGLGVAALGAGYLFFTKDGKEMLEGFMDSIGGIGGGDDDFDLSKALFRDFPKSVAKDPGAFIPGSDRWYDIVSKNRGKAEADRLRKKALQQHYIESYMTSAFL